MMAKLRRSLNTDDLNDCEKTYIAGRFGRYLRKGMSRTEARAALDAECRDPSSRFWEELEEARQRGITIERGDFDHEPGPEACLSCGRSWDLCDGTCEALT
jgi:hypothetical protein